MRKDALTLLLVLLSSNGLDLSFIKPTIASKSLLGFATKALFLSLSKLISLHYKPPSDKQYSPLDQGGEKVHISDLASFFRDYDFEFYCPCIMAVWDDSEEELCSMVPLVLGDGYFEYIH